ncbi:hypothetical protein GC207_02115 [bacterium]|nr:hypothetical protein [bacterium]
MLQRIAAAFGILGLAIAAQAQTSTFTYQGYLTKDGNPFTGNAEFVPTLWDAGTNGNLVAGNSPSGATIGVTNGLFILPLNFGDHFPGADRWLQVEVRTPVGSGSYVTLAPRQQIQSTPYAITAANLSGNLSATQLSGSIPSWQISGTIGSSMIENGAVGASQVNNAQVQLRITGSAPAGQFITGVQADGTVTAAADTSDWKLLGNAGTSPITHFIGTTDAQPLNFRVGNQRALRLEYGSSSTPNLIGGSGLNVVSNGVSGATISGGGESVEVFGSTINYPNTIGGNLSTIGGGAYNAIGTNSLATISGGFNNSAFGHGATIGGGTVNRITSDVEYGVIGGGAYNTNSGSYATVPGGQYNVTTGQYSFAAGYKAKALHDGTFVWADPASADFNSTGAYQFLIRAAGGVGINTNNPTGAALSVVGGIKAGPGGSAMSRMEFGTANVGTGVAGVNTFTISFPTAFSAVPKVFVTPKGNDNPDTFAITTRAVSTTSFKVNIVRIDVAGGWGQALQVDWYAVE